MITLPIIEQHFHGAFGVDFNTSGVNEIIELVHKMQKLGVGYILPTLVTDTIDNIKRQTEIIKKASEKCPQILGIHLEGIFLNPEKKGIHNSEHFLELTVENYKKIEDDFIKIVTLAPELDNGLMEYLKEKGTKIQAGHCIGWSEQIKPDGVTHLFNAMSGISHKTSSTANSALLDDSVYTEVIADGVHVIDDALKLLLKTKPSNKILLISDALPITYSNIKETVFADSKIYYDGIKATSKAGTLAGSTKLLPEIIKILGKKNLFLPQYIENSYNYLEIEKHGKLIWDDDFNIIDIEL